MIPAYFLLESKHLILLILLIIVLIISSCHFLVHMLVCMLMGQK